MSERARISVSSKTSAEHDGTPWRRAVSKTEVESRRDSPRDCSPVGRVSIATSPDGGPTALVRLPTAAIRFPRRGAFGMSGHGHGHDHVYGHDHPSLAGWGSGFALGYSPPPGAPPCRSLRLPRDYGRLRTP